MSRLRPAFGSKILGEIKKEDVEAFIENILPTVSQATTNRYLARLSAMFKRAIPSLATVNPVKGIKKFKEAGERDVCLTAQQEKAILDALSVEMRPYFLFGLHTGLRWSKQMGLRWLDVDLLTKAVTIGKDKNGRPLRVPFNSTTEAVLLELGTQRIRPNDPHEPVFARRYREPDKFFPRAVKRAQGALRDAGHHDEAARLDGVAWHGATRHTWASRLTMNGVDPRTLQTLGGWRSLSMVERYSHLSPAHLRAALEKLVNSAPSRAEAIPATELDSNLTRLHDVAARAV
jgi:integrase